MSEPGSSPNFGAEAPSSPLFVGSSSPGRDALNSEVGSQLNERTGRLNISEMSSPMRFSSSPTRGGRTPRMSSTAGVFSDLSSAASRNNHRRGTAHTRRGDIFSSEATATPSRRKRYISSDIGSSSDAALMSMSQGNQMTSEADTNEPRRVIWGTNVSIQDAMNSFRGFLQGFKIKYRKVLDDEIVLSGEGEELLYMDMLAQMRALGLSNLNLDARNLLAYPPTKKLYHQLINYPQEIVPIMDQTVKDCMVALVTGDQDDTNVEAITRELDEVETRVYKVRPYGLDSHRGMRELNPGDIDKLICVKGLVLRATSVIPDMKDAFFKCAVCNHTTVVEIDRGIITEPTKCPRPACGQQNSMQIIHNRSSFSDKQVIKLQETPDIVPDGQTPHSISLCVYDELVDVCKAGDRVEITGIFRSVPVKINPRQRSLKSLFKTYVDVVHIQKVNVKRMGVDVSTDADLEAQYAEHLGQQEQKDVEELRKITDEDIQKIREVAARPDVYELLARSLAPSIYENDDVKKGILLQLFGGANKTFHKGGAPRYRGEINILLCGDPSTSKSQLLQYVHKIAPRGIYTSGKGSSAVGLTAYVTRDPETRQLVLESGALVLSDGGVCCIDEFDKMSDTTRAVLHEVMEQQTVSIAKAGIITTLNARSSILASANPIGSKYDTKLSVTQNIDLPPTLLSRFDLVYLMIDKIDPQTDRMLANHLTNMYLEDTPETASKDEILPIEFLTMYISYAKQHVQPRITPEAKKELVAAYVAMRKLGEDAKTAEKRITATTRQLESLIRLSEAHAKMRFSDEVLPSDVAEAVRLIRSAIKEYAMDPLTGTIDMDLIQTGTSMAQRRMRADLKSVILQQIEDSTGGEGREIRYDELFKDITNRSSERIQSSDFSNAIAGLELEGRVIVHGTGQRRLIRKTVG